MDLSNPASAVVPTLDAAVLAVLVGTNRPLTGREVQRLCGHSQGRVQAILNRMTDHGLVDAVEAGPARLYTLNREHVAAEAAVTLSNLRGRLFERIRKRLVQWPVPPVAAAVFGSAARGDGTPGSDIDVLIVRPAKVDPGDPRWDGAVDDLSRAIARWSGNHASIIQATPTQIAEMVKRGEPIVADLQEDAVPLTETPVLAPPRRARR